MEFALFLQWSLVKCIIMYAGAQWIELNTLYKIFFKK